MDPSVVTSFEQLEDLYRSGGWVAFASGCVFLAVKWYKSGWFDFFLARILPSWRWTENGRYYRLTVVAVLSAAASTLAGMAAGQVWWVALLAAIPVAVGAIGANETAQTVAKAEAERVETKAVIAANRALSINTTLPGAREIHDEVQREIQAKKDAKP